MQLISHICLIFVVCGLIHIDLGLSKTTLYVSEYGEGVFDIVVVILAVYLILLKVKWLISDM